MDTNAAAADVNESRATVGIHEGDVHEDEKYTKTTLCFNPFWPEKQNMNWARFLVSPFMSSNKIAPSKSDLLAMIVNARPKIPAEAAREESGRGCETSGVGRVKYDHVTCDAAQVMQSPAVALLPPRYLQRSAGEGGAAVEFDKETATRMAASRITIMIWLQNSPSLKAVNSTGESYSGLQDDLSFGHGMLEMCDEEEVKFDCQSQATAQFKPADGYNLTNPLEQVDLFSHVTSLEVFADSSGACLCSNPSDRHWGVCRNRALCDSLWNIVPSMSRM